MFAWPAPLLRIARLHNGNPRIADPQDGDGSLKVPPDLLAAAGVPVLPWNIPDVQFRVGSSSVRGDPDAVDFGDVLEFSHRWHTDEVAFQSQPVELTGRRFSSTVGTNGDFAVHASACGFNGLFNGFSNESGIHARFNWGR